MKLFEYGFVPIIALHLPSVLFRYIMHSFLKDGFQDYSETQSGLKQLNHVIWKISKYNIVSYFQMVDVYIFGVIDVNSCVLEMKS